MEASTTSGRSGDISLAVPIGGDIAPTTDIGSSTRINELRSTSLPQASNIDTNDTNEVPRTAATARMPQHHELLPSSSWPSTSSSSSPSSSSPLVLAADNSTTRVGHEDEEHRLSFGRHYASLPSTMQQQTQTQPSVPWHPRIPPSCFNSLAGSTPFCDPVDCTTPNQQQQKDRHHAHGIPSIMTARGMDQQHPYDPAHGHSHAPVVGTGMDFSNNPGSSTNDCFLQELIHPPDVWNIPSLPAGFGNTDIVAAMPIFRNDAMSTSFQHLFDGRSLPSKQGPVVAGNAASGAASYIQAQVEATAAISHPSKQQSPDQQQVSLLTTASMPTSILEPDPIRVATSSPQTSHLPAATTTMLMVAASAAANDDRTYDNTSQNLRNPANSATITKDKSELEQFLELQLLLLQQQHLLMLQQQHQALTATLNEHNSISLGRNDSPTGCYQSSQPQQQHPHQPISERSSLMVWSPLLESTPFPTPVSSIENVMNLSGFTPSQHVDHRTASQANIASISRLVATYHPLSPSYFSNGLTTNVQPTVSDSQPDLICIPSGKAEGKNHLLPPVTDRRIMAGPPAQLGDPTRRFPSEASPKLKSDSFCGSSKESDVTSQLNTSDRELSKKSSPDTYLQLEIGSKTPPPSSSSSHSSSTPLQRPATDPTAHGVTANSAPRTSRGKLDDSPVVLKPLSAYNYFFRDERYRLLNETDLNTQRGMENSEERKQWLLSQHWLKDRTKRRQHRTTHGKIDFTRLSKFVGQKWRELPESEKDFYRSVAKADLDRYKEQERNRASKGKNNGAKI